MQRSQASGSDPARRPFLAATADARPLRSFAAYDMGLLVLLHAGGRDEPFGRPAKARVDDVGDHDARLT
jgi:hypothetical protein